MAKRKKLDTKHESDVIAHDFGKRKKFHPHDLCNLTPASLNQERFLQHFYDDIPMITAQGPAGTGKTFLALYAALSLVLDESTKYDKIVIIRSAVETRSQGFVKGSQEEKNAPYERPYIQSIEKILPAFKDGYSHLKALGYLEFETTAFLRGQTLDNYIVICDEMQNCDYDELSTIITRVGDESRIVLLGNDKQCDLHRKREKSGLGKLNLIMDKMPSDLVGTVEYNLEDIQRGGRLVREFLRADYQTA